MRGGVTIRGTNSKRALLVSSSIILLCITIVMGMTWALFTDTQKVTNHLQAGTLAVALKRTELVKTTLNDEGFLVESAPDTTHVNFTNPTDENVFGIENGEKIVPGTKYVAKMQIDNKSDVAFGYWIEVVCTDKASGEDLAEQLKVTVNAKDSYMSNGLTVGSKGVYIDVLEKGTSGTFTVTVEFEDLGYTYSNGKLKSKNDAAEGEKLSFDLVVYAVQVTTDPTP